MVTAGHGGRHLLVLNRWGDEFGRYDHIDHARDRVAYVTTADAVTQLSDRAEEIRVVPRLDNRDAVLAGVRGVVRRHGALDGVIALSEFDLELAAEIRECFDIPGRRIASTRVLRDKVAMKERVGAAGVRVPRFAATGAVPAVRALVAECGLPVVRKPRRGASSQGVVVVRSATDLDPWLAAEDDATAEWEEHVPGDVLHVDGLAVGGRLRAMRPARYLGTCLGFAHGEPLGSVGIDDPPLTERLGRLTQRVLAALGLDSGAFHLEVIHHVDRLGAVDELVFLEIGGRVGGGEIPFLWRDVYGLNLIAADARLQVGDGPAGARDVGNAEVAGSLRVPGPAFPCRVLERDHLLGRIPGLYEEVLPPVGAVLGDDGEHIGGRFRFRGPSSAAVESAVRAAMRMYRLRCEACAPTPAAAPAPAPCRALPQVAALDA